LSHGVRQIKKTIELCSSDVKNRIKRSFIICTRVPVSSAEIQNLRLKFKRDFNSDLIVKSSPHIYTLWKNEYRYLKNRSMSKVESRMCSV